MYPLCRLVTSSLHALLSPPVDPLEPADYAFICRPWDIDMFLEMNNGRILTLYDLGRFVLAIRSKFMRVLRENKWGLVVAGCSVRYRKRIKVFDRVTIRSQIVGMDSRWIYVQQSMWVKGVACSSCIFRTGVTSNGKTVSTMEVKAALGLEAVNFNVPLWVSEWIKADAHRPWPPEDIQH